MGAFYSFFVISKIFLTFVSQSSHNKDYSVVKTLSLPSTLTGAFLFGDFVYNYQAINHYSLPVSLCLCRFDSLTQRTE
jgi:hypothetical protein